MIIRLKNGKLVVINITDYLTDYDYYKEIIKIKAADTPLKPQLHST